MRACGRGGLGAWLAALLASIPFAGLAYGFSLLPDPRTATPQSDLAIAARWSPEPDPFGFGTGFHDGVQVAVVHDFAALLQVTDPAEAALVQQVIRQAFEAWETPDLRFDIDFARQPVEGTENNGASGFEFDLFAVPGTHPVFADGPYFGYTLQRRRMAQDRLLTNGTRTDGFVITGVDVYVNIDLVLQLGGLFSREQQAQALQRLLMHEIGHGLGLGHPNTYNTFNANYDTDMDPLNVMVLDPRDPFTPLIASEMRDPRAIMSNDRSRVGPFLFFTELQNDDRGGRDALYPSLHSCAAGCSGNGRVDVAEIIAAVNVALELLPLDNCHNADRDGDQAVGVNELVAGVNAALSGCGV